MSKRIYYKWIKEKVWIGVIIGFFIALSCSSAYAAFKIGPVKGAFTVAESGYYNSNPGYAYEDKNIEGQGGNKLDVFGTLEVPFLELHKYSINGTTSWFYHYGKHDYDHTTANVSQALDLDFNKWLVNIHHNYLNTYDPDTEELVNGIFNRKLTHKRMQYPGIVASGDLGKLKLTIGYDYQNYKFNRADDIESGQTVKQYSRDVHTPFIETAWHVTPLIDLFQGYRYQQVVRKDPNTNDSIDHRASTGIRGRLTSYLTTESSIGYGWVIYDNTNNENKTDYKGIVASSALTNTLTPYTTQKLGISFEPIQSYNAANFYKAYLVNYTISHRLNTRINVNGGVTYGKAKEDTRENTPLAERCHFWKYNGGVNWNIFKNTSIVSDYAYTTKSSYVHAKSYHQHVASLGLAYNF